MAFRYRPEDAISCLPAGDYQATIENAEEQTSKAGNDMLVVTFKVYAQMNEHRERVIEVKEYIVDTTLYKLKQIAKAIGQEKAFLCGEFFAADYVGHNCIVTLKVESSDKYGDQNKISAYKPLLTAPASQVYYPPVSGATDEKIPF